MRSEKILNKYSCFFIIAINERSMTILFQDFETAPGCAAITLFDEV
jgi:hypothetical protein